MLRGIKRWLCRSPEKLTEHDHSFKKDDLGFRKLEAMWACKLENYFFSHARDIIDESDEILQPQLQVIYTIGLSQHVEGFPE